MRTGQGVRARTQVGMPVCEYVADTETAAEGVARARELLGPLVARDAAPAGGESGERPPPPCSPWDPMSLQVPSRRRRPPRRLSPPKPPDASGALPRSLGRDASHPFFLAALWLSMTGGRAPHPAAMRQAACCRGDVWSA